MHRNTIFHVCLLILTAFSVLDAKTWYVSNTGSDDNTGEQDKPFKTISKGAELAQPGDTVFVFAGIYRERVAPPRGGTENAPIIYQGEPGKQVFIKGSDVYDKKWSKIADDIFAADLNLLQFTDDVYWDSANPFKVGVSSTPYQRDGVPEGNKEVNYTLGQVFVDSEPYLQLPLKKELEAQTGSWWYDPEKNQVLVHFKTNQSPKSFVEITTRRRIFAPHIRQLGYIHVIGFIMEHCGNQFARNFWEVKENAQAGALGLRCGHHWLIKNNVVRYAANIGIDCGAEGPNNEQNKQPLWHDIWRNVVHNRIENNYLIDNGSNGIAGWLSQYMVFKGNVVMYNNNVKYRGWNRFEQAGVKFHENTDSIVEENYIVDNFAYGIWLDNKFFHARLTRNVIVGNHQAGVFLEMSDYDFGGVLVDHNVIMNNRENQFYMHDASGALVVNNLIAGTRTRPLEEPDADLDAGIVKRWENFGQAVFIRQVTERTRSYHNSFYNNLFCGNDITYDILYPLAKGGEQRFLGNVYDKDDRAMRINNQCAVESPLNEEAFKLRLAAESGTNVDELSYDTKTKRVQLNLAEWQKFWLLHSMHNDADAQVMSGLSAEYEPETQTVRLTVSEPLAKRNNARWDSNSKLIYGLTETESVPGPFGELKAGTNEFRPYQGLPPVKRGELPNPEVFINK
jgi:hypothetical protein